MIEETSRKLKRASSKTRQGIEGESAKSNKYKQASRKNE